MVLQARQIALATEPSPAPATVEGTPSPRTSEDTDMAESPGLSSRCPQTPSHDEGSVIQESRYVSSVSSSRVATDGGITGSVRSTNTEWLAPEETPEEAAEASEGISTSICMPEPGIQGLLETRAPLVGAGPNNDERTDSQADLSPCQRKRVTGRFPARQVGHPDVDYTPDAEDRAERDSHYVTSSDFPQTQ
jgi:hypothetical protein